MFKIIIVDDEPLIVKGLSKIIRSRMEDVEIVATAQSAHQAYEAIIRYQPDLVITDIEMAGENGLSLPEEMAGMENRPSFVVISGYNRFEYAQRALRSGVDNYLLKPVDEDELISVLTGLFSQIRAKHELDIQSASKEAAAIANNLHILMLGGDAAQGSLSSEMLDNLHARFHYASFVVLRFFFDCTEELDLKRNREILSGVLMRHFDARAFAIIKGFHKGILLVVLNANEFTPSFMEGLAQEAITALSSACCHRVIIGISEPTSDLVTLQRCGMQATNVLMMRLYEPNRLYFTYALLRSCRQQLPSEAITAQETLAEALHLPDPEKVWKRTLSMYQMLISKRISPQIILQCFSDVLKRVLVEERESVPELQEIVDECAQALRNAMKYKPLDNFLDCLKQSVLEVNEVLCSQASGTGRRIIVNAQLYIQENCASNLSLSVVAAHLQISASYLSYLFKQETGQNFSSYINHYRLSMAKKLLVSQPNLRVYEVAERVGYHDVKYFTRIFRQNTLLTPKAFREQYAKS